MKKIFKALLTTLSVVLIFTVFTVFSVSAAGKTAAPKTVKATTTVNSIYLSWSKVSGADGYRVYYKTSEKAKWKTAVSSTTKTNHSFKKLPNGKVYYFAVRSYDKTNKGTIFGGYKELTTATKPIATKKLTATQSTTSVKLTWNKVATATHYRIYQKVGSEWKALGYTTKLNYTVKKLSSGTKYTFSVRSYIKNDKLNVAGNSKTVNAITKPVAPSNLKAYGAKDNAVLKWDTAKGATAYKIYQKTTNGWKALGTTSGLTYTVKNLKADTTYTFAVKSCIKTSSGMIEGSYKEVKAKTDKTCVAITDGGVKLYPITSAEAKEIKDKWGFFSPQYYEGKSVDGKTLIYSCDSDIWCGIDIKGAYYDTYGKAEICPYCGKNSGEGNNMCTGCLITFA